MKTIELDSEGIKSIKIKFETFEWGTGMAYAIRYGKFRTAFKSNATDNIKDHIDLIRRCLDDLEERYET